MVVNLFTNPDMVATSGEVVVWENHARQAQAKSSTFGRFSTGRGGDYDIAWLTNQADGPLPEITNYARATAVTPATSGSGGWNDHTVAANRATLEGSAGDAVTMSIWMRYTGSLETYTVYFRVYAYSGTSSESSQQSFDIPSGEWVRLSHTITPEESYDSVGFWAYFTGGDDIDAGGTIDVTGKMVTKGEHLLHYFDETFSPDPDLTPQPRPGGGSELVGQRVAGLSAENGVVVQSEQWSKSGGKSARIINNTGDPVTVTVEGASVFTRLWTYDGAKETLATLASPSVIPGPETLGESKWVDLITSTAQRYDGPLFSGSTPNSADDSGYGWGYEWVGEPDASPSTREYTQVRDVAIMVVEDLDAPAVGITVEGLSSVESSRIAIYRQTPGKERTLVQGLGNVDVDGAGYWVDYLPPLGVPVTYVVEVLEGDPLGENSATITIPSSTAWLQDALNPLLAVEVACRPGNRDTLFFTAEAFTAFERPTNGDLVSIMGGRVPVGMTSRRQTPVGIPFNMVTTAAEASSLLREVLIEGTHLVLRVPPEISMLDPVTYLSDVQVSEEPSRQSFLGGHVIRWNMTGSQTRGPRIVAWTALWTYDDVADLYAGYTYTDLTDGRRYVDWQARPDEAQLAGFSTTSGGGSSA